MPRPHRILLLIALLSALPRTAAAVTLEDALERMRRNAHAEAVELLEVLVAEMPESGLAWFNLGTARFNLGEMDGAIEAFFRVVALDSPLAPGAALCLAKCFRRKAAWSEARRALADAEARHAPEGLVSSERGALAAAMRGDGARRLDAKDFAAALALFDHSLAVSPAAETTYLRALALLSLGRYDESREGFRAVLVGAGGETGFDADARYFLDRLDTGVRRGPVWLNVEAGMGYDSNVFLGGESESPLAAAATLVTAGGGWQPSGRGEWLARLGAALSWEENLGQALGRFLTQSGWAHTGYENDGTTLRLAPSVHYAWIGDAPYLLRARLGFLAQQRWRVTGLGAQLETTRSFAQDPAYSYLDGATHEGEVHFDYLSSRMEMRLHYSLLFENTGDLVSGSTALPIRDRAHGPGIRIYWLPVPAVGITLSLAWLRRDYRNAAQPGNLERIDDQALGALRVSHRLTPELSLFATATFLLNRSTLGASSGISDRNYTQLFTVAGVSWNAIN